MKPSLLLTITAISLLITVAAVAYTLGQRSAVCPPAFAVSRDADQRFRRALENAGAGGPVPQYDATGPGSLPDFPVRKPPDWLQSARPSTEQGGHHDTNARPH
jgi:hypothetical protein